jgi:two-component system OmpR family response regulator
VRSLNIAVVENNPHLRSLLGWHLREAGYVVRLFPGMQQALESFKINLPILAILNSELSDGDGLELCSWLHGKHNCAILILSSRSSEKDIVRALKTGADDYLTKPFGMQELLARVEALMRRTIILAAPLSLNYGDLKIDLVQRRVFYDNQYIDLTPQEFSLIYVLAQAAGSSLSRLELLQRAWPEVIDNPRTVDTHILSLRKKIEPDPKQPNLIQTVRNIGYRFNLEFLLESSKKNTDSINTPKSS